MPSTGVRCGDAEGGRKVTDDCGSCALPPPPQPAALRSVKGAADSADPCGHVPCAVTSAGPLPPSFVWVGESAQDAERRHARRASFHALIQLRGKVRRSLSVHALPGTNFPDEELGCRGGGVHIIWCMTASSGHQGLMLLRTVQKRSNSSDLSSYGSSVTNWNVCS